MSSGHKWQRLKRAQAMPARRELVEAYVAKTGLSFDDAKAELEAIYAKAEIWKNDLYQVEVRREPESQSMWLCIRRVDGYPGRDWRHFQQIKDELAGPECEAVELYPAQSRLVDTSNKYHLFCCTDPTVRFPFGYSNRDVSFEKTNVPGMRQAPPMQFKGGTTSGQSDEPRERDPREQTSTDGKPPHRDE